jgi:hypothetical protein
MFAAMCLLAILFGITRPAWAMLDNGVEPENLGKGDWIWVVANAEANVGASSVQGLVNFEKSKGMRFVIVKGADGGDTADWTQFNSDLVTRFHAAGIKVFAFQYVYGSYYGSGQVQAEINAANYLLGIKDSSGVPMDGLMIDAEIQYNGRPNDALTYCQGIRAVYPNRCLIHSPYPIPSYNTSFPYIEFGRYCNVVMPQDYWYDQFSGSGGVTPQYMVTLMNSDWNYWQGVWQGEGDGSSVKPLAPIGQGFQGASPNPIPGSQLTDFMTCLKTNTPCPTTGGIRGISFWVCDQHTSDDWNAIQSINIGNAFRVDSYAGNDNNGNAQIFLPDAINHMASDWQGSINGSWVGWNGIGGTLTAAGTPAVGYNADGRMQIFVRDANGTVWSIWKTSINGSWNTWQNYGGNVVGTITVGYLPSGAMQIFGRSPNNTIVTMNQTGANSGWTGWSDMGGSCYGDPVVAPNADGRMQLFFRNSGNIIQTAWKTTLFESSAWSSWSTLNISTYGKPCVGLLADGTMQFFTRTGSNTVQSIWQTGPNAGWASASDMGGNCAADPVLAYGANGTFHVFICTSSNTVSLNTKSDNQGGSWSGWGNLGGNCAGYLTVGNNGDGRIQVYMRDSNYNLQTTWQTAVNGSTWNSWFNLSGNTPAVSIATQPSSQTVNAGQNVTFSVVATNALTYQWTFNGGNISGATGSSYTINNAQSANAGTYAVVVGNHAGSVTSANATLTVNGGAPAITTQPSNQTVNQGQNATFSVVATGSAPLAYQWTFNGGNISGATASSYTVVSAQPANAGTYAVVVTNSAGSVTSANASLTVNVPPSITTQPSSVTVTQGQPASFSVVATGTAPLSYQWQFGGANISGATGSSYSIASAQPANAGNYDVIVNNVAGSVTSATASLTVNVPPSITTQPATQTVNQGQNATFSVVAAGTAPLSYQWTFNGGNITGATASSLTITNAQAANAGTYAVVVTNVAGTVTSATATLTVILPPIISTQPASQLAAVSNNVTFTVGLSQGSTPLSYQWKKNGANISGATLSSLTLSSITWGSAGTYSVVVTNVAGSATSANATLTVEQAAFTLVDGFESYNLGVLDQNQSGGPNTGLSNPWWGPAPPNMTVFTNQGSIAPHGGSKMIGAGAGLEFCQDYLNFPYRLNSGSNYYGNIMLDWWFYDPKGTGSGATNYDDYFALAEYVPVSLTNDFTTTTFTQFNQRMSLGAANVPGYNVGVYQARIVGATGGANTNGWFNTSVARTVGWHHARIVVGVPTNNSGPVSMFIDNMTNAVLKYASSGVSYGFNLIEINSSFGGLNTGGYFDDMTFRAANDPWVAQPPASLTNSVGSNPTFATVAVGTSFQWQFNGTNLSGATTSSYTITNAQTGNAGTYSCVITGANGTTNTSATLTVQ